MCRTAHRLRSICANVSITISYRSREVFKFRLLAYRILKVHTAVGVDLPVFWFMSSVRMAVRLCEVTTKKIIQGIHKRMVRFQKLTRNLFLTLHGHNVHRQQRQLSMFLMRYQQFASHAYCGASFQDGVAAGKGFLCAPF